MYTNESNNTSGTPYEDPEPYGSRIFRQALFGVIITCAVAGNGIVFAVMFKYPGKGTLIRRLVLNLAFAELVFSICHAFLYHQHEVPYGWVLGPAMCKLLIPLQVACNMTTTITLAEIAVYRCVVLRKLTVKREGHSRRLSMWIVFLTWIVAGIFAVPSGVHYRVTDYYGTLHCMEVGSADQKRAYLIYLFAVFVANHVIPLTVICLSYALVCVKVRRHIGSTKRWIKQQQREQQQERLHLRSDSTTKRSNNVELLEMNANPLNPPINEAEMGPEHPIIEHHQEIAAGNAVVSSETSARPRRQSCKAHGSFAGQATLALENDLLRIITAIILIYVICYLPYQIHFLWYQFDAQAFQQWKYGHMFSRYLFNVICAPSALHPFIYGLMSKYFRSQVFRLLQQCLY